MMQAFHPTPRGFTLIESLVVVGIIVILVAIAMPTLRMMRSMTNESIAVNTVQLAAATARGYANRPDRAFLTDLVPIPRGGPNESGSYSGYAAIFTPGGEARIVENLERARYNGFPLERIDGYVDIRGLAGTNSSFNADNTPPPAGPGGNANIDTVHNHLNGFLDGPIAEGAIEYIDFPADTGFAGIVRTPGSGSTQATLVPPPFAVWYDENGQLVSGSVHSDGAADKCVYYDGNYDGNYDIFSRRPASGYDPGRYDPASTNFDPGVAYVPNNSRLAIPFERLDAVIGVWTYSKRQWEASVAANQIQPWTVMTTGANNGRWTWLRENGKLVMFSHQAGTPMRSSDE